MKLIYFLETVFCKRFFYFLVKLFSLLLLIASLSSAAIINGKITDSKGNPVPFAYIRNIKTDHAAFSDEQGYFSFGNGNQKGDTLQVQRIGFHTKKTAITRSDINIVLLSKNINLQAVTVEGKQGNIRYSANELLKIEKSSAIKSINNRGIFSSIPGAYIKSYGGSAGISTLSMDGAPTRHTKILVSGFDITNAQNGQVDLSQLPENFIENIAYDPNGSSASGNSGSEGVVNVSPWQRNSSVYFGLGSFGQRKYGFSMSQNFSSIHLNLLAGKSRDEGNYKGYNPVADKFEVRKNNYLEREYISLRLNGVITQNIFSKVLYLYSEQDRGVAGQIWSPTPESYRRDSFHLLGTKLGWVAGIGSGYFRSTLRNSFDHFYNAAEFGFPVDSRHDVRTYRHKLTQNFCIKEGLKFISAMVREDDYLKSNATGSHQRTTYQSINSLEWSRGRFMIIPGYSFNYSPDLFAKSTWNYTLEYILNVAVFSSVAFNYGQYFYYPSFNDLFWQPGGNKHLKPEETINKSINLKLSILAKEDLKIVIFDKSGENLIHWLPSQSYWQPKNVKESMRRGAKIIYHFTATTIPLSGFVNYNYNFTEDKTTGKALLYSPRHSAGINLDYNWNGWQFHYQGHYTDKRVSRYSWPENITLAPLFEQTFGCSYDHEFKYGSITGSLLIENLMDKRYETVKGYPEPGRRFKLRMQYYFKKSK